MTTPAEIRISQGPGHTVRLTVRGIEVAVPRYAEPADVGFGIVVDEARTARAPVQAVLIDEREVLEWRVLVHPDGSVTDDVAVSASPTRRPLRLAAGTALVALLVMAGVATAATGIPSAGSTAAPAAPSTARPAPAAPPSVAMEVIPAAPAPVPAPATTSAAAPPTSAPTPSPGPVVPVPVAIPDTPTRSIVPVPAPRTAVAAPVRRTSAAAAPVVIVVPTKAPTAAPTAAPAVAATTAAPVQPGTTLSDPSGRCLTAGLTVAPCNGSAAQAWNSAAGRLSNGGRCLAYGNGLVLVDCAAPRTQGWATSVRTTTNAGNCLEAVDGRAVLTQCGTGKALVLTSG